MGRYKVAIIPGHGGFDPGAVNNVNGVRECDGNLAVALKLAALLKSNGIDYVLSRTTDIACGGAKTSSQDVTNQIAFVNGSGADIAVAIHFNSSVAKSATGTEVLYCDLMYPNPNEARLANLLLAELAAATGLPSRGLKAPDNISIIKKSKIPCVLSECAFVSNDAESVWCSDPAHQQRLAVAHAKAICKYFGIIYKEGEEEEVLAPVKIKVNGKDLPNGHITKLDGKDTSFAPVRTLAEALGAKVTWDDATSTVVITK